MNTSSMPEQLLHDLSHFLAVHTGLSFPPKKWPALTKSLGAAARESGFEDPRHYAGAILKSGPSSPLLDALVERLTIGETYFLRDKQMFQAFQDHIIRGLIDHPRRPDKSIRFWSAGCATGEEPYSIAILMDRLSHFSKSRKIDIIGTDVNQQFLNVAKIGIYTPWSLRSVPAPIIETYFTPQADNRYELIPRIRRKVRFSRLNFAAPAYKKHLDIPQPVDVILCRNVLMYHDAISRTHILNSLLELLEDNGWLITAPAESGFVNSGILTPVRFSNAIFFRKGPPRKSDMIPEAPKNRQPPTPEPRTDWKPNPSGPSPPARGRRASDNKKATTSLFQEVYEKAVSDYNAGRYKPAVEKLNDLLRNSQFPNTCFLMHTESIILLARCHANLGDLKEAESACQKAIASEKLNPGLYYLLSTIYQAREDIEAAIRSLKQTLYLDPDFVMAQFQLGFLLRQKGRFDESSKRFTNTATLLKARPADEILPYSEGMTAGRLLETVQSLMP